MIVVNGVVSHSVGIKGTCSPSSHFFMCLPNSSSCGLSFRFAAEAEEKNWDDKAVNERWARWYTCRLCEQRYHGVVVCALEPMMPRSTISVRP